MTKAKKLQLSLMTMFLTAGAVTSAQAIAPDKRVRAHGGWYVEAEPFLARTTDTLLSTLPFASSFPSVETDIEVGTFTEAERFHYFDPDRDWGFRVAVGYDFCGNNCCNYGFSLEYTHFDTDDNRSVRDQISTQIFGPLDVFPLPAVSQFASAFGATTANVDARLDFKYDAVDLLGHKNWTVCNCVDVQAFAGARYVRFREDFHTHFFNDATQAAIFVTGERGTDDETLIQDFNSRFDGAGPRVGFNVYYPVVNSFGIVAEVATDLIFGESRANYFEHFTSRVEEAPGAFSTEDDVLNADQPRHNRVVPGLSGKVALAYRTSFCNCSSLSIEAGYRGDKYFDLANHSNFVQAVEFDEAFNTHGAYHDVDISGPYINVSYHM